MVGTADAGTKQIAFYDKNGFRKFGLKKNFFIDHYEMPIYEDRVQLKDMVMLKFELWLPSPLPMYPLPYREPKFRDQTDKRRDRKPNVGVRKSNFRLDFSAFLIQKLKIRARNEKSWHFFSNPPIPRTKRGTSEGGGVLRNPTCQVLISKFRHQNPKFGG